MRILAYYMMPSTLEQNDVAERRNRTLMDKVRNMMSTCHLQESLCGESLKTVAYTLNRFSNKSIPKMPFELLSDRKPNANQFPVWGCIAEVKIYNPQIKKIDHRSMGCYFVVYLDRSQGYTLYYPS